MISSKVKSTERTIIFSVSSIVLSQVNKSNSHNFTLFNLFNQFHFFQRFNQFLQQILFPGNEHPVREQRHRLASDQTEYNKRLSSTEYRLQ